MVFNVFWNLLRDYGLGLLGFGVFWFRAFRV